VDDLTLDRLTRDISLWQRKKGHRFSADDVITAWVAVARAPQAKRILDLGCGIGSVLLHLRWSLPEAACVGIEAQDVSYALLEKNIAHNQVTNVTTHHGDLRDLRELGHFDLITGTPPYFPVGDALDAEDPQRAYARIEYRGGVEAYITTAARHLDANGSFVLCGDARAEGRVEAAAKAVGLQLVARLGVIARAPNPPLFAVWTLAWTAAPLVETTLTLRDRHGERTPEAIALKAFSGIP
jgi:tRNA1Val (adenine37-N6)-methyltransferase